MPITSFTTGFPLGTPSIQIPKLNLKGLTQGLSGLSLAGFNQLQNANKLSPSNTPQVSLNDFKNTTQKGFEGLGNINIGLVATMALPMVTGALKSAADKPLQNMTPEQRLLFEAIYGSGDSVLGDLFNMKQNVQNSIDSINSNIHTNTGALGSMLDVANNYNNTNFNAFKQNNDKMSFGQGLSRIADSAAKGFSTGMASGNLIVGGITAAAAALGSGARMLFANKNRNTINNTAELAENKTFDNLSLQAENTQKQMNLMDLANANYAALGGLLNYNIDDKYLANDYMSKLNNRVYKPLFDSMNYFAMGGSPDFNEFNTGGTHELNSNGGIPIKEHLDGTTDVVEENETMADTPNGKYIFSDRLKLSKEECKMFKVPEGSTYAEASKILRKEYDERPNDNIARKGWELMRDMLIQSLEILKQEIALKEARKQGLNSPKMQGVNPQVMQDMYYNEIPQEEVLLQQGINPNILNAFGGLVKKFLIGGNTKNPPDLVGILPEDQMPTYGRGDNVFRYYNSDRGFEGSNIYTNGAYNPDYLNWLDSTEDFGQYFTPEAKNQMLENYNSTKGTNLTWKDFNTDLRKLGSDNIYGYYTKMMENAYNQYLKSLNTPGVIGVAETPESETSIQPITDNFDPSRYKTKNKNYSDYIPLATSVLGLLSASLDYSLPNRLYNEINKLPRVSAPKSTNYMTYNPIDINRYLNQYNAQAASTRNAIMNTSNPNRNASLLAATYNNNIGYGNLVQSLEAQNQKERMGVQQFNKSVDDSNALYLMQANSINQGYDQMGLNSFIRGLDMENKIQQDYAKAIQGGLQGIDDFYNNRAAERKGLMTAGLAAVSQGTPFTDAMIKYSYNIDPYLGDALFSSRGDYSNYVNMQHRNDVVKALKNGTYDTNYLGNLSRYTADPYVVDFIKKQYKSNKNFDFKKYGLTQEELNKIIGVG